MSDSLVAYAYGTVEDDRLVGTFGFDTDILVSGTPFADGFDDEYEFYATPIGRVAQNL